jgi:hypothetical protein
MSSIFISYSSKETALIKSLGHELRDLGYVAWSAPELTGGHEWWTDILTNIRACDIFIFALSPHSLNSYPCNLEYTYASALGKPILPVLIDGVNTSMLPTILAKIQFVDYRHPENRESIKALVKALNKLPPAPLLPDPLPTPPEAPIARIAELVEILNKPELSFSEQTSLVFELKNLLGTDEDANARLLLKKLLKHPSLRASIAQEINGILTPPEPKSVPLLQRLGIAAMRLVAVSLGAMLFSIAVFQAGSHFDFHLVILLPCSIVATIELPIFITKANKEIRAVSALVIGVVFFIAAQINYNFWFFFLSSGSSFDFSIATLVEAIVFGSGFAVGSVFFSSSLKRFIVGALGMIAGIVLYSTTTYFTPALAGLARVKISSDIVVRSATEWSALALVLAICAFVPEILLYVRARRKQSQMAS